jgi:hypothetical protein
MANPQQFLPRRAMPTSAICWRLGTWARWSVGVGRAEWSHQTPRTGAPSYRVPTRSDPARVPEDGHGLLRLPTSPMDQLAASTDRRALAMTCAWPGAMHGEQEGPFTTMGGPAWAAASAPAANRPAPGDTNAANGLSACGTPHTPPSWGLVPAVTMVAHERCHAWVSSRKGHSAWRTPTSVGQVGDVSRSCQCADLLVHSRCRRRLSLIPCRRVAGLATDARS